MQVAGGLQYAVAAVAEPRGQKRGPEMSWEDGIKKVKRTVGWYNKHGGLNNQIIYKTVRESIEALNPREALKILKGLEEKGTAVNNPTAWVKKAAERLGPELDKKVRKTISWYNKHGGLAEPIRYDEVRGLLGYMPPQEALKLLKSLDGKGTTVNKPTAWICKAAQKKLERDSPAEEGSWDVGSAAPAWGGQSAGGTSSSQVQMPKFTGEIDVAVKKTIGWYNKKGGLQQEIVFDEVAPFLVQLQSKDALQILKGLEDKAAHIKNPTAWITKAAQNALTGAT